jgi:hypothetical protein
MISENAFRGRINEILLGYHVNNSKWYSREAKKQLDDLRGRVDQSTFRTEDQKAEKMADAFVSKARGMGYSSVKNVFWIGDGNVLTINSLRKNIDPGGQMELDLDPKTNPSDLLVEFHRGIQGKFERWLGISAKSSMRSDGKIGFKNPGLGTMDEELGLKLTAALKKAEQEFAKTYRLSPMDSRREVEIKKSVKLYNIAIKEGDKIISDFRDAIYKKLNKMSFDEAHQHLLKIWLNAGDLYPPYLKVTGSGENPPFQIRVENPNENNKLDALNSGNIRFIKARTNSITVMADGKRLFNMRLKFKGTKMASTVKLSADSL